MRCLDRRRSETAPTAYDFTFQSLGGGAALPLSAYAGKALLVVNVASACGYTSQYRELQQLWDARREKGLVVIGVPCNDFGAQESGDEATIRSFCDTQYHVTFPMVGKAEIIGAGRHPFYAWIADAMGVGALPRWNFHKYLIGRDGDLIDGFPSSVAPLGPKLLCAVDQALAG